MTRNELFALLMAGIAVGSFVFFVDYMRTAIVRFPWTQHILALNVGIFITMTVSVWSRLSDYSFFWTKFIAIGFVGVLVWLQIPLLHYVRRMTRENMGKYPELDDETPSRKNLLSLVRRRR